MTTAKYFFPMAFCFFVVLLPACTHTRLWDIERREDGGTVGYQLDNTEHAQTELDSQMESTARRTYGNRPWK